MFEKVHIRLNEGLFPSPVKQHVAVFRVEFHQGVVDKPNMVFEHRIGSEIIYGVVFILVWIIYQQLGVKAFKKRQVHLNGGIIE